MSVRVPFKRVLSLWQRFLHIIKKIQKDWGKQEWKLYKCGNYTDIDEKHCPGCGLNDEPNKIVNIRRWRVKRLAKKGRVWTKHPTRWWFQ